MTQGVDPSNRLTTESLTGMPAANMRPVDKDEAEPTPAFDALTELLGMDTSKAGQIPTDEVDMSPRFKSKWKVRALDDGLNERLLEEASEYKKNPRTGQQIRELNTQVFARLVVYHCVLEPNLKDPKLLAKYGLRPYQHETLVKRVLPLPGYVDRISSRVMDLSGFSDQLVDVAKNSSEEEG
jgi:hypothetical protein